MELKVVLDDGAYMPTKAHEADAGFDLRTPIDAYVAPHGYIEIDTGCHVLIPEGYVGFLKSKSGLNVIYGIRGEGVIDAGYTGSIVVKLYNDTDHVKPFNKGDKIIQLVILPIPDVTMVKVNSFNITTDRGDNGFGSSGK